MTDLFKGVYQEFCGTFSRIFSRTFLNSFNYQLMQKLATIDYENFISGQPFNLEFLSSSVCVCVGGGERGGGRKFMGMSKFMTSVLKVFPYAVLHYFFEDLDT